MDQKLLPIGTIIKVNSSKAMIIGYGLKEMELLERRYIIVPYPAGLTKQSDMRLISGDVEVVEKGYENEVSKILLEYVDKVYDVAETLTGEEFSKHMKDAQTLIEEN